jgi:hypothetical protein
VKPGQGVSAAEFRVLAEGDYGIISANDKCADAYDRVQKGTDERAKRRRRELYRYFKEFCSEQRHRLSDQQFKAEGKYPDGRGGRVQVYEFKAWQFRLYGCLLGHSKEKKWFVAVDVDEEKKKNKADVQRLKSAALHIGRLNEYMPLKPDKIGERK